MKVLAVSIVVLALAILGSAYLAASTWQEQGQRNRVVTLCVEFGPVRLPECDSRLATTTKEEER